MKTKPKPSHTPVILTTLPEIQKNSKLVKSRSPTSLVKSPQSRSSGLSFHSSKISNRESLYSPLGEKSEPKLSVDLLALNNFISEAAVKEALVPDPNVEGLVQGPPSSRKDVLRLIEWLDSSVQTILATRQSPEELFDITNEIFSTCLSEVIRQVSVQCKERGYLIQRVWSAYKNLFERALIVAKNNEEFAREKFLRESNAKTKEFAGVEKSLNEEIKLLKEEVSKACAEKMEVEKQCEGFKGQVTSYLERICYVLERYKVLRKEIMCLREENRVLGIKLQNCGEEVQASKPKFVQKKFKIKSLRDLTSLMAKDPVLNLLKFKESDLTSYNIQFGRIYVEKELNQTFREPDFKDSGNDAPIKNSKESETQTQVIELCEESVGVKKRSNRFKFSFSYTMKPNRVYIPEINTSLDKNLNIETQLLLKNPNIPELRKKHLRVRKILSIMMEVTYKQEYPK